MNDTRKILSKYISNFIFLGIIIGIITFFIEMAIINKVGLDYPSQTTTILILIFILSTVIIHMIACTRTIEKARLTEEKKVILTKTIRVFLGIIALFIMIADFIAFSNINKSFIKDYRNIELSKLKETVINGDNTEEELDQTQKKTDSNINNIVYMCMGTKEITDVLVYLGIVAFLESKIKNVKNEDEENCEIKDNNNKEMEKN